MNQYLFIIAILLYNHFSFGQGKFGIKIYQNTDVFSVTTTDNDVSPSITSISSQTNFNRISIALQIKSRNKLNHQIELMIPEISKQIPDVQLPFSYQFIKRKESKSSITTISFRYEISKSLYSFKNFRLNLGFGLSPYYVFQERKSYSPNFFDSYLEYYGASFNTIPYITYNVTNRFGLEISFPFTIYNLQKVTQHIANPAIPIKQQTNVGLESNFSNNVYTIRFGMLYVFNK
jgi:hypothetical protein